MEGETKARYFRCAAVGAGVIGSYEYGRCEWFSTLRARCGTLTIQLPESLRKRIAALAAQEGYSVSQFLASAAGEKLAVVLTMDYLRREAAEGRREDFERYLAAAPDVPPVESDRVDK